MARSPPETDQAPRRCLKRQIRFHPGAVADAEEAFAWYRAQSPAAADAFLAELELAMAGIVDVPERFVRFGPSTRRALFDRFPFSAVYRIKGEFVEVVAIAHAKRRPGYWRSRLS